MVFEKAIALKTPKTSMCHGSTALLNEFVESANCQLQLIIDTDDIEIILSSTKILCDSVNEFLLKISENHSDNDQMNIRCDILR